MSVLNTKENPKKSKKTRVAINGFGRIGRLAFKQMFNAEGYEVVAINDLTNPKMLAHLLKYDFAQGKYALADTISASEDSINIDGKEIKIYAKVNAAELPWAELDIDVVLECTKFNVSKAKSQAHIKAGAKKVIVMNGDVLKSPYKEAKEERTQFIYAYGIQDVSQSVQSYSSRKCLLEYKIQKNKRRKIL